MKKYLRILFLLILLINIRFIFANTNILILNSYSTGLSWSDEELKGIFSILDDERDLDIYIEYMDSKRFGYNNNVFIFGEYFLKKYKDTNFDIVITLDNAAFDFVLENYDSLFEGTPIVFAGINYYQEYELERFDYVSGIVEIHEMQETLDLALKLHKDIQNIYVVVDGYTKTSLLFQEELKNDIIPHFPSINFIFLSNSLEEIEENLKNPAENSIVLFLSFNKDSYGNYYSNDYMGKFMEQFQSIPIYTTTSVYMNYNVVGGKIVDAYDQGRKAGEIASKILSGTKVQDLERYYLPENKYIFNYSELQKFNIPINLLPKDSIVLNKPPSIIENYPILFWIMIISIIFLAVIIFIIRHQNVKLNVLLKKVEEKDEELQSYNEELLASNEQLTSANEQLVAQNEEIANNYKEIESLNYRIQNLLNIISELGNESLGIEIFFEEFLKTLITEIPEADYGSISIIEGDSWKFLAAVGHNIEGLKSLSLKREYAAFTEEVKIIYNIMSINENKMPQEIVDLMEQYTKPIKATMLKALKIGRDSYLDISLDIKQESDKIFTEESVHFFDSIINLAKAFLVNKIRTEEVKKAYITFASKLATIIDSHDENSYMHIYRVSELSAFLAEKMGFTSEEVENIRIYAPLHDVGKLFISPSILNKNGGLTEEEWEEIRRHPLYAENLLEGEYFETAKKIALYHHERYDGSGYPFRLRNGQIPLEAQIVGLVDVYDALRSKRSYKEAFSHERALEILLHGDSRTQPHQFNPKLLKIFKEYEKEIEKIYENFNEKTKN